MELTPPIQEINYTRTHRLIPSRFPPVGILNEVASPEDLTDIFELESWTNDRISEELGIIERIPPSEWVLGNPNATIIMAAFCHPRPGGSRFNDESVGAWYAALSLKTAHAEVLYHRQRELAEVGVLNTSFVMRDYVAEFKTNFHSLLARDPKFENYYDPISYRASQELGTRLRNMGSNGIVYRSVRDPKGKCVVCFRPRQVLNVRQGSHFEYKLSDTYPPSIHKLNSNAVS